MTYVDVLCRQLTLRIQVIGDFRRKRESGEYHEYERFVQAAARAGAFGLDSAALVGSSVVLSTILLVLPESLDPELPHATAINISGAVGVLLALLVEGRYRRVRGRVGALAGELREGPS